LDSDEQIALTLHAVCGSTIENIARAFLVPTTTMARRLAEAKAKAQRATADRDLADPPWHERLHQVMATLYLLFNEGYTARRERSADAIALTRRLRAHFAEPPAELEALLALMLLHDARRDARVDENGEMVLLVDQDRSRWNAQMIAEGGALTRAALRRAPPGEYALQAAIAALHSEAVQAEHTDWRQIRALYERLLSLRPSAVIALNHAVAVSMCDGPAAALPLVDALASELADYHLWQATRAHLLRRLDRCDEAIACYRRAHALAPGEPERRFLRRRLAELEKGKQS
jgi:RNA polymerase sigma-70 factor (ECF subfamily)